MSEAQVAPLSQEEANELTNQMWDDLKLSCGGYNGAVDLDVLNVVAFLHTEESRFYTHIAEHLKLPENYIEFILYVLGSCHLTEYGTSPRGSWLTDEGDEFYVKYSSLRRYLLNGNENHSGAEGNG